MMMVWLLTGVVAPHVGHLHTMVLCDAYARWNRTKGHDVLFSGGTDEHGMRAARTLEKVLTLFAGVKIQQAATKNNIDVREHCDHVSSRFRDLFNQYNISVDDYVRTCEPRHMTAASALWRTIEKRGYIYKGSYQGWYSVADESASLLIASLRY